MSRMYDIIQELCRRDGTDVTKMCRALKIPRSTLSELASGRTKQLTLKHARPIAEYFGVTIAQLAGDEPLETEPDQTDAVSDLIRDEPIAAYENLKRYLTEEDKACLLYTSSSKLGTMPSITLNSFVSSPSSLGIQFIRPAV